MKALFPARVFPWPVLRRVSGTSTGSRPAAAALFLACAIWGTSFLFGKLALRELTVSQLLLLRFGLGSLTLLPILFIRRSRIQRKDLPHLLLTGFLAVPVTFLLQFHGLALTTISRASLIIGAGPPFLALGGMLFFGERPGVRGWVAVLVSMLGILAISGLPGDGGSWAGDGLVFLSILISMVWVIMVKRLSERLTALVATTYVMLFGTLTLVPFTLLADGLPRLDLPGEVWLNVFALGVACTALAFVLWNWGIERFPASRAGLFLNIEPMVGAFLGVTIMHESLGPGVVLGGTLVVGAALLESRGEALVRVNTDLEPPKGGMFSGCMRTQAPMPNADVETRGGGAVMKAMPRGR